MVRKDSHFCAHEIKKRFAIEFEYWPLTLKIVSSEMAGTLKRVHTSILQLTDSVSNWAQNILPADYAVCYGVRLKLIYWPLLVQ